MQHQQSFFGQEVHVSFSGLSFTVDVDPEDVPAQGRCSGKPPKVPKRILNSLSGRFEHGKLTAIMGASGAGKTTMLNCISGEASMGTIDGQVLVNGQQIDSETMRRVSAFVFQDDIILDSMTVREAIYLSARLRLPKSMSVAEKEKRVQQVIDVLHLQKCADTICGSPTSSGGISGGERKRTAVGMELITNPSVLFLDEPSTGLDTYTAFSVMDTLRQLALTGRTVVATIHQPSSDTFHLFDNLLVLSEGNIVYQGSSAAAVGYFGSLGYVCPHFTNPADYLFMKVLNVGGEPTGSTLVAQQQRVKELVDAYHAHPMSTQAALSGAESGGGIDVSGIAQRPGFLEQVPQLMLRNLRNITRNPMGIRARIMQALVMSSVIALIYHGLGHDQAAVQSRTGALFFCSMNMMMSAFSVLAVFFQEKTVFEREQSQGMYSTSAFFVTKVLTELPQNILLPFLQAVIIYFPLNLQRSTEKFFLFAMLNILNINAGQALGIFIASMFTDLRITLVVAPPLILPLMIFSGFFINTESIPPYFNWIKYISPIKYTFEGMALNEFTGLDVVCASEELQSHGRCTAAKPRCFCPITSGEQVLQRLNMDDNLSIAENIGCLVGIWCGMLLLAFLSLRRIIASREAKRAVFTANAPATKRRSLTFSSSTPARLAPPDAAAPKPPPPVNNGGSAPAGLSAPPPKPEPLTAATGHPVAATGGPPRQLESQQMPGPHYAGPAAHMPWGGAQPMMMPAGGMYPQPMQQPLMYGAG